MYNPDWYYTQGPEEPEDVEEEITRAEQAWEAKRDQELLEEDL